MATELKIIMEKKPENAKELGELITKITNQFIKEYGDEKSHNDNLFVLCGCQNGDTIEDGNNVATPMDIAQIMFCKHGVAIDVLLQCIGAWRKTSPMLYLDFLAKLFSFLDKETSTEEKMFSAILRGDDKRGISELIDNLLEGK